MKVYRRLRPGGQPEIEVARFLTEQAGYRNTPAYLGAVEHHPEAGDPTTLAAAFAFVQNQGDAWTAILMALERVLEADDLAAISSAHAGAETVVPASIGNHQNGRS